MIEHLTTLVPPVWSDRLRRGAINMRFLPIAAALLAILPDAAAASPDCAYGDDGTRICGIPAPEDLTEIPGTPWVLASSMPRDGSAGGLYMIDKRTRRVKKVTFGIAAGDFATSKDEASVVGKCTPPDPTKLVTHGLSLSAGEGGVHQLYVVGHGGREAIELFNVDTTIDAPSILWTGCVPMPEGLEANSVVGLPGGGLMFTSLYDPGETAWPERIGKLAAGAPSGGVFEWQVHTGIRRLAIPPMSGPNGIAVSQDGKSIFLAGWGDSIVRRLDRKGNETAPPIKIGFLPDNLHWAPDGSLLASGQNIAVEDLFACSNRLDGPVYCAQSWDVARISPTDVRTKNLWRGNTGGTFGDSTAAIIIGRGLWIGSISGDCLAIMTPAEGGSHDAGADQRNTRRTDHADGS
ncbi:MAG: hypothetical protein H6883_15900 [Rhodobiaceae bacterium]|nr:hypothetical protein [Rhodobiaceae bacterium]